MNYSIFTQYGLERAKKARDNLKESKRKKELYNIYRNENDLEKRFYNYLEVPMREFIYNLSTFNFMNFRRFDRLFYSLSKYLSKSKEYKVEHDKLNGALTTGLGLSSLFLSYITGLGLIKNFNQLETFNKIGSIGLEILLLGTGIVLTNHGIKRILKIRKQNV